MIKMLHIKRVAFVALFVVGSVVVRGQSWSPSEASPELDCGEYHWPLGVQEPCPKVVIKQKGDHHPDKEGDHRTQYRYRRMGWDTVVSCENRSIVLSCMPYIPVQKFNGMYYVDPIPYNPPDTTFARGTRMPIGTDDVFASTHTTIAFPFYFFGIRKDQFRIGANGLVTFCSPSAFGSDNGCPYSVRGGTNNLPWNNTAGHQTPTYSGDCFNRMHDAIYGVYEDTDPAYFTGNETNKLDGIYYGVQDEYPCQKILCSWKEAPDFSSHANKGTYQIVCYEGSNIIEVHVKRRSCCPTTSDALIGIQNATGQPQVASTNPMDPNSMPSINGKPPAFFPANLGNPAGAPFTNVLDYVAYRFTPRGQTDKLYEWFRVFDDGRPNYVLQNITINPAAQNDTNGYYIPMDESNPTCPTLTKAIVSPKMPSRYVFHLRFKNANNDYYDLYDTIFVGVDTLNYIKLHKQPVKDTLPSLDNICVGDTARMRVDIHTLEQIEREEWSIYRISQGDTILLDTIVGSGNGIQNSYLTVGNSQQIQIFRVFAGDTLVSDTMLFSKEDYHMLGDSLKIRPVQLFSARLPQRGRVANKIDTIYIVLTADFVSGCHNYDTMMIRIFPDFEDTVVDGICRGETYHWMPKDKNHTYHYTYTDNTDPATTMVTLESTPGCDSIVRLQLTVFDISYTVDHVTDCKPFRWQNGKVYTMTNTATAERDTVVLANAYGCDSIVQLSFTMHPLTAKLQSDIDHFDLDHLDAVLTDISIGGNGRVWKMPGRDDQTEEVAYYSIPVELDGAEILLIESSEYGCLDTAKIYIPLNKEHFWVPNAFTPDNPAGNNRFASVSTRTLYEEMRIFNRRGEMVFHCEGTDCEWDGRDLNGNPCIQGAYVYIIRYTNEFEPEKTRVVQGTVTLIR